MPTTIDLSLMTWGKSLPLSDFWYSVSWKKMTPPTLSEKEESEEKRMSRKQRRFSSVFSTLIFWRRFPMVPWIRRGKESSVARSAVTSYRRSISASLRLTCWLICSQNSLSWSHNLLSDVGELLLLLRRQWWELMSHPGGQEEVVRESLQELKQVWGRFKCFSL